MRWALRAALGRCAESEDFQAPMRAAGRLPSAEPARGGRTRAALRPVRESEVIGPGWTQAVSTDHSKLSADEVRQLQGFDQVLNREQGKRIAGETFLVSQDAYIL